MKNKASRLSTLMGYLVAIAQAWANIDWANFDIKKAWPTLVISGVIALGGHVTSINLKQKT